MHHNGHDGDRTKFKLDRRTLAFVIMLFDDEGYSTMVTFIVDGPGAFV